jgi:malonate-semialdehyde dehydrogenase (acetylating)/methylmalonate-semialdehyde dehydrogenase
MEVTMTTTSTTTSKTLVHLIGGKPVESQGRKSDIFNPATGEVQKQVALATAADVGAAVDAAKAALGDWRNSSLAARTRILFGFRELVNRHKDDIARLLTLEHGKVFSDAQGEVQRGLEVIEFACGLAQLLKGELSENVSTDVDS